MDTWVYGYQKTDKQMHGGKQFKIELNKLYSCANVLDSCKSIFSFYTSLEKAVQSPYFDFNNRYFHISALVSESDAEEMENGKMSILSSKEIIFINEVSDDELWNCIYDYFPECESVQEFKKFNDWNDYWYYVNRRHIEKSIDQVRGKYSESFLRIVLDRPISPDKREHIVKKMLALYDEGISPDMRAYILLFWSDKHE